MIDISIITPCFNLEKYIQTTYDSIKCQEVNWEWIIVDDGSNDLTIRIIECFNDDRVILVKHQHVGNLSILRNFGSTYANGKIFAFIDGDDWYKEDALKLTLTYFQNNPQIDFCHTDTINFIESSNEFQYSNKKKKLGHLKSNREYLTRVLRSNPMTISTLFIRRQVFFACGQFNENFKYCEDLELWIRLLSKGYKIGFIGEPVLFYRIRGSGLFNTKRLKYLKTNFKVYRNFLKQHPFLYLINLKSIISFYSNNYYSIYMCLAKHKKLAKPYYWLSVIFDPRKLKYVHGI